MSRKGNPLTDDPGLKKLLNEITNIPDELEFKRWKDAFLKEFDKYLSKDGTANADKAFQLFSKGVVSLAKDVHRMEQFRAIGDMTEEKCSVQARRCLGNFSDKIVAVTRVMHSLVPGTQEEEKKAGFTKFNLGAILVRDGFVEYDRLEKIQIHLGRLRREGLDKVADSTTLFSIEAYGDAFDRLCDILADLGLYQAMEKCTSFIKGEWVPTTPAKSAQSLGDVRGDVDKIPRAPLQSTDESPSNSVNTSESPRKGNSRPQSRDNRSGQDRSSRSRGREDSRPEGPRRAKSLGPTTRADDKKKGMGRSGSDQFEFVLNANPDWKGFNKRRSDASAASEEPRKASMTLKRPETNGRSDPRNRQNDSRNDARRSKSVGPPPRRPVASMEPKSPAGRKTPMRSRSADDYMQSSSVDSLRGRRRQNSGDSNMRLVNGAKDTMPSRGRRDDSSEDGSRSRPTRPNPSVDSDSRSSGPESRGIRRNSSMGSDNRSIGQNKGRSDGKSPMKSSLVLRPNMRDNNATVRQKKDVVATNKKQAAGPTPWRQRMQEERAAKQQKDSDDPIRGSLIRRKSFSGFPGSGSDSKTNKSDDSPNARERARSMTPWRGRRGAEENAPRPRRGVSLGRRQSPDRVRDDDSAARGKRNMTPFRRRGDQGSTDDDSKSTASRGRAAAQERQGRSRTPASQRRPDEASRPKSDTGSNRKAPAKQKPTPESSKQRSPTASNRDAGKPRPSSSSQKPTMKLSRDAASVPKKPAGSKPREKSNRERGPDDGKKDPRRKKISKFFKKKEKDGQDGEEDDDPGASFSIEDSTPGGARKARPPGSSSNRKPRPKKSADGFASADPTSKMFQKNSDFAAPRRDQSLLIEDPGSPFHLSGDNPFANTDNPFHEADDPFAKAADPFAEDEPNFVGVDDDSSSSSDENEYDDSSSGSESDESGSFFTSSEEDDSDDSDDSDSSEDDSTGDEDDSSDEEKPQRKKKPVMEVAVSEEKDVEEPPPPSPKGHMPKRKAPQGRPDDDGFCPCCGQHWPNYDKWTKMFE